MQNSEILKLVDPIGYRGIPLDPELWLEIHNQNLNDPSIGNDDYLKQRYERWPFHLNAAGRLHCKYKVLTTTRMQTYLPPIGNMNKAFRKAVRLHDHYILELDYRQSHWRILAALSQDEALIADILGGDFYGQVATTAKLDVRVAKDVCNAIANGGRDKAIRDAGCSDPKTMQDLLRERYPKAFAYLDQVMKDPKYGNAGEPHKRVAHLLQGVEADALRFTMSSLKDKRPAIYDSILLPLHDAIILAVPQDKLEEWAPLLQKLMCIAMQKIVRQSPVFDDCVKVQAGPSWGELTNIEAATPCVSAPLKMRQHWVNEAVTYLEELRDTPRKGNQKAPSVDTGRYDLRLAAMVDPDAILAVDLSREQKDQVKRTIRKMDECVIVEQSDDEDDSWIPSTMGFITNRDGDPLRDSIHNIKLAMDLGKDYFPKIQWDQWRMASVALTPDGVRDVDDSMLVRLALMMQAKYDFEPSKAKIDDYLTTLKDEPSKQRDAVRDYIDGLKWDMTPRLENVLADYLGAVNSPLVQAYSRVLFCSAMQRALYPGSKSDLMIVLKGPQGCGKSRFVRGMIPACLQKENLYHDNMHDVMSKDTQATISGKWIIEVAEMVASRKADTESMKAFLTRQTEVFRRPYAIKDITVDRRCIFVGTTNEADPLTDATGNRRYAVVDVTTFREEKWNAVRDQVWAEAKYWLENCHAAARLSEDEMALQKQSAVQYTAVRQDEEQVLEVAASLDSDFTIPLLKERMGIVKASDRMISDYLRNAGYVNLDAGKKTGRAQRWSHPEHLKPIRLHLQIEQLGAEDILQ